MKNEQPQFSPLSTDNNTIDEQQQGNTSHRKFLIIGGAVFAIAILGVIVYFLLNMGATPSMQSEIKQSQSVFSGQEENIEDQEKFILLLGGKNIRSNGIYQFNPTLNAQILDSQRKLFAERLSKTLQQESIYRIEFVRRDGTSKSVNSSVNYCPSQTDVCEVLMDREPPSNSQSHWSPTPVVIESEFEKIKFSIAGEVIKTITIPAISPKITAFDKTVLEKGVEITWDVDKGDAEYAGLFLEYLSSPNNWQTAGFGDIKNFTSFTVDSDSIQSTLEILDFRLVATDGFHVTSYLAEDFIATPIAKELVLSLSGMPDTERIVGQNMFLKLSFVDPQTGTGCSGAGCQSGVNQDKYEVTWTSDKQNICPSDIYKGTLQYRFKKTGVHTVTVKVRHKEKEYPVGEAMAQISVNPSPFPIEDSTNPNCSF